VLLLDGSFREWFGSRFGRERALYRPYRSLNRLGRLRFVSCCVAGLVIPFERPRPSMVCWLGAILTLTHFIYVDKPSAFLWALRRGIHRNQYAILVCQLCLHETVLTHVRDILSVNQTCQKLKEECMTINTIHTIPVIFHHPVS
jgi:hypothetical protein